MQDQILIVDDHQPVCKSLSEVLKRAGYEAHMASNGYEALEAIRQERFAVVVTDIDMPKMDGLEILQRTKALVPDTAVVIMTGCATVDTAVSSMKYGAYDYITKPISSDKIKAVVQGALTRMPSGAIASQQIMKAAPPSLTRRTITADSQMLDILKMVSFIAPTDSTVLVQGESGTGKELIARAVHENSLRSRGPFIPVNCAALPEALLESELFGYERGAFTGANTRRIGRLEMANGGTILLDEVSEMTKACQAKLLRAIQEREVIRMGGGQPIKLDVRIVATTNKVLSEEVDNGNFREDLFFRLFVLPVYLPPLRERKDDVPLLAQYFAQRFCDRMRKKTKTISPKALELLKSYTWPGNVRELEGTMERAVALSQKDVIAPADLIFTGRRRASNYIALEIGTSLQDVEREFILRTLEKTDGNKKRTADILGITSKTIRNKLRKYGFDEVAGPDDTIES